MWGFIFWFTEICEYWLILYSYGKISCILDLYLSCICIIINFVIHQTIALRNADCFWKKFMNLISIWARTKLIRNLGSSMDVYIENNFCSYLSLDHNLYIYIWKSQFNSVHGIWISWISNRSYVGSFSSKAVYHRTDMRHSIFLDHLYHTHLLHRLDLIIW